MPIPFDRFRLLNGTDKPATGAKYREPGRPVRTPPPPEPGKFAEEAHVGPTGFQTADRLTVEELTLDGGFHINDWAMPEKPDVDIWCVDILMHGAADVYQATATVTYEDGTFAQVHQPFAQ